ncbi:MAG: hypothetical protein ACREBW_02055 [Candidatus Micrarchaeaceae archaeon]
MTLLEDRQFQHSGKTFSLKLFGTDTGFSVVAFLNDQQVSPSYTISFETHTDYFMQHKASLTESLFGLAQSDLEHGMYFRA